MHHRVPSWALLPFWGTWLFLLWAVARQPFLAIATGRLPAHVLGGRLFTERFNTVHAGFCLDQPTIGKWLFWFVVACTFSAFVVLLARWLGDRRTAVGHWMFAVPVSAVTVLLISIVIFPLCMLVQYVYWMGFTPRRILGLLFCCTAMFVLPWCWRWLVRRPAAISCLA